MSRYTQKLILQTFGEMLDEMAFDKITVSALTRRSDISHNTFYYHYNDIYDLLEVWIRREVGVYLADVHSFDDWEPALSSMLRAWQKDERRIYHVFYSLSREQLERHVFDQADVFVVSQLQSLPEAKHVSEEQLRSISNFARYIFFGFLMRFLWSKMKDDVDSSVHEMCVMLRGFLLHAFSDAREGAF